MKVGSLLLRSRVRVQSRLSLSRPKMISHRLMTTMLITDVTGNQVKVGNSSSLNLLDEAIFNFISSEDECSSQLVELLKDSECTMARTLLLFDMLSQGNTTTIIDKNKHLTVDSLLRYLEDKAKQDQLNTREMHLVAAALAFAEGHFFVSAKVLSSLSQELSFDALNLKLLQSSYKNAGDMSNYFSCIAQCSYVLNNKHHLHGHLQGMLALGQVENGRYQQAEDTANRSISLTRGKDVSAIEALLQAYQLSGRTTEIFAILESRINHHDDYSKPLLLFHDAIGKIQRGNYSGAAKTFEVLVDHADDNPTHYPVQSVVYATMILWQISNNSVNPDLALLWQDACYTRCWKRLEHVNNEYLHDPLHDICRTMYLYQASIAVIPTKDTSSSTTSNSNTVITPPKTKGLSIWQWMETTTKKHRNKKIKEPFQLLDPIVAGHMLTHHLQRLQVKSFSSATSDTIGNVLVKDTIPTDSTTNINTTNHSVLPKSSPSLVLPSKKLSYPTLREFQLQHAYDEVNQADTKRQQAYARSYSISEAVISFMQQNYEKASIQLKQCSNDIDMIGGCSAVEKEILQYHTLVEALLRIDDDVKNDGNENAIAIKNAEDNGVTVGSDGIATVIINDNNNSSTITQQPQQQLPLHLQEAKRMCNERVVLCVNDAQAWRRLSSLLGRSGQYDLAHFAHHTAWQLGIGQGGFGGPQ